MSFLEGLRKSLKLHPPTNLHFPRDVAPGLTRGRIACPLADTREDLPHAWG